VIQDVFEAVGAVDAGQLDERDLAELERSACPGVGSCAGDWSRRSQMHK